MRIKHVFCKHCHSELNPDFIDLLTYRNNHSPWFCKVCGAIIRLNPFYGLLSFLTSVAAGWFVSEGISRMIGLYSTQSFLIEWGIPTLVFFLILLLCNAALNALYYKLFY